MSWYFSLSCQLKNSNITNKHVQVFNEVFLLTIFCLNLLCLCFNSFVSQVSDIMKLCSVIVSYFLVMLVYLFLFFLNYDY